MALCLNVSCRVSDLSTTFEHGNLPRGTLAPNALQLKSHSLRCPLIHVHRCLPDRRVLSNPHGSRRACICCLHLLHEQDRLCSRCQAPWTCGACLPWSQRVSAVRTASSSHACAYSDAQLDLCAQHDSCSRGSRPCGMSSPQSRRSKGTYPPPCGSRTSLDQTGALS